MNSLGKTMNYAWMSQASYLDLSMVLENDGATFISALKTNKIKEKTFTKTQAELFTNGDTGISFVHHLPNTKFGTSATVCVMGGFMLHE